MTKQANRGDGNPLGLNGISFVEYCGASGDFYDVLFAKMGMRKVGGSDERSISVYRQSDICFVVNHEPDSYAANFAALHGPCISGLGFRVADAEKALAAAFHYQASALDLKGATKLLETPVIEGIGGSCLYLVDADQEDKLFCDEFDATIQLESKSDAGFFEVDHLTHNVVPGKLEGWVKFYENIFGFRAVFEIDAIGKLTGMHTTAVLSPCGRFRIAINEPTEAKSQIQEFIDEMKGEGVQHIALASHDLYDSMEYVRQSDIEFQEATSAYYEMLDDRLPDHGEDVERLERLGILLDGEDLGEASEPRWGLLLQIFSKNLIGPVFFEFIQRKNNEGFGEGNAVALFESIERDQVRRKVLG